MMTATDCSERVRCHLDEAQTRDRAELATIEAELADPKWADWQRESMVRRSAYLERVIALRAADLDTLDEAAT
jgi:hypothetical protein